MSDYVQSIRISPARLDLTVYRGDTPRLVIVLPLDLTGYSAHMDIRDSAGAALVQLSSLDGGLLITPNTGRDPLTGALVPVAGRSVVRMRDLSNAEEGAILGASFPSYDLEVRQGASWRKTYLRGRFRLEGDVTL